MLSRRKLANRTATTNLLTDSVLLRSSVVARLMIVSAIAIDLISPYPSTTRDDLSITNMTDPTKLGHLVETTYSLYYDTEMQNVRRDNDTTDEKYLDDDNPMMNLTEHNFDGTSLIDNSAEKETFNEILTIAFKPSVAGTSAEFEHSTSSSIRADDDDDSTSNSEQFLGSRDEQQFHSTNPYKSNEVFEQRRNNPSVSEERRSNPLVSVTTTYKRSSSNKHNYHHTKYNDGNTRSDRTRRFLHLKSQGSSQYFPVLPLIERPHNPEFDPQPQDLESAEKLVDLMGGPTAFRPSMMSVTRPDDELERYPHGSVRLPFRIGPDRRLMLIKQIIAPSNVSSHDSPGTNTYAPSSTTPKPVLPTGLAWLAKKLLSRPAYLPYGPQVRLRLSGHKRRRVSTYLWAYTHCPLLSEWRDLGHRFWPRWIREASCYKAPGASCSIPPGMSCVPDQSTYVTLLRWHCQSGKFRSVTTSAGQKMRAQLQTRGVGRNKKNCGWIPIQYPILKSCTCGCSKDG